MQVSNHKKRRPSDRADDEDEDTQIPSKKNFITEDDKDTWPAEEILREKNGLYLIKWKGEDPQGNPWEDSWVKKRDVTDDLIQEWNKNNPRKKKRKAKGKNPSSQSYQPPTHLSARKSGETSSNATNKRNTRASKSLAPDSVSTRRSESFLNPERLQTPPKKRKRSHHASSVMATDGRSDDDSTSPRKKRKVVEVDIDLSPTTPSPSHIRSSKSNEIQNVGASSLDIYDDIPVPPPPTYEMKKLLDKAKVVSKLPSNGKSKGDYEKVHVAKPSPVGKKKLGTKNIKANEETEGQEGHRDMGIRLSAAPEEEEEDDDDNLVGGRGTRLTKGPKKNASTAQLEADEDTRHSRSAERLTPSKDQRSASPEAQVNDADVDADGEPDEEHVVNNVDHTFNDNSPAIDADDLPLDQGTNHSPYNSPPPQAPPPPVKEPQTVDTSLGTVIPETQSSKHNSSLDESSQLVVPTGVSKPPDAPNAQDESVSASSGKVLKPIPVVTPSKFRPHLKTYSNVIGKAAALRNRLPPAAERPDPPPSSIVSQFSPEKNGENSSSHWAVNGDDDTDMNGIEDDIENLEPSLELKARGMELAEMDRMQRRTKSLSVQKRSLVGILHHRDTRRDAPAGHALLDEDALIQHMEEQYVNLDGGAEPTKELAENTAESPRDAPDGSQLDPYLTGIVEETRHVSPTTESSQQDDPQPVEPQTPPQSHTVQPQQKRQIINTPTRQLDSALGLLNQKSEEIHDLKNRLSDADEERRTQATRITQLEAENARLSHEQSKNAQVAPIVVAELDIIRKERDDIARERDSTLAELDLMKMSKQSALDEAAFIREQYDLASNRATELAEENTVLLSRAKLAETQVTNGLQLVRNEYDSRLATLNIELEKSRILSKILVERDRRTDDEVRKTAATVPNLEATIERLTKANSDRKEEVNALVKHRNTLLIAENESKDELNQLREQNAKARADVLHLSVEVARFGARERSVRKLIHPSPPEYDADTEVDPADEDVYLCEWLVDGETRCGELFPSVQDLQDHLFISAHL